METGPSQGDQGCSHLRGLVGPGPSTFWAGQGLMYSKCVVGPPHVWPWAHLLGPSTLKNMTTSLLIQPLLHNIDYEGTQKTQKWGRKTFDMRLERLLVTWLHKIQWEPVGKLNPRVPSFYLGFLDFHMEYFQFLLFKCLQNSKGQSWK